MHLHMQKIKAINRMYQTKKKDIIEQKKKVYFKTFRCIFNACSIFNHGVINYLCKNREQECLPREK